MASSLSACLDAFASAQLCCCSLLLLGRSTGMRLGPVATRDKTGGGGSGGDGGGGDGGGESKYRVVISFVLVQSPIVPIDSSFLKFKNDMYVKFNIYVSKIFKYIVPSRNNKQNRGPEKQ